jgi:hypothetical protein
LNFLAYFALWYISIEQLLMLEDLVGHFLDEFQLVFIQALGSQGVSNQTLDINQRQKRLWAVTQLLLYQRFVNETQYVKIIEIGGRLEAL